MGLWPKQPEFLEVQVAEREIPFFKHAFLLSSFLPSPILFLPSLLYLLLLKNFYNLNSQSIQEI